jgi:interferon gamma-inducible protein 30
MIFRVLILFLSIFVIFIKSCNIPPDFWCDSYEIAQRCNVVPQCQAFKNDRRPIKVTLMYEALCPFCQRFITNHLGNLYNQFRGNVEIEMIPWGNSRLLRTGQISCNHGQKECDANRLMSCVIDEVKVKQAIPFIICFERALSSSHVEQAMHHCSGFIRNNYHQIKMCYQSERGVQLQRQAAHKTATVRSHPVIEVPYIVINDYSPSLGGNNLNIMALKELIKKWISYKRGQ